MKNKIQILALMTITALLIFNTSAFAIGALFSRPRWSNEMDTSVEAAWVFP